VREGRRGLPYFGADRYCHGMREGARGEVAYGSAPVRTIEDPIPTLMHSQRDPRHIEKNCIAVFTSFNLRAGISPQ